MNAEQIAELERLAQREEAQRRTFFSISFNELEDLIATAKDVERLKAERDELVSELINAGENIASWGAYAGEYFQKKWDLNGDIQRIKEAIAKVQT